MKRVLFALLLLSLMAWQGCSRTGTDTGTEGVRAAKKDTKSVTFVIYEEKDGTKKILAIPETLIVEKGLHKVHFAAYNNLDTDLDHVDIDFMGEEPLDGGKVFKINGVFTGDHDSKESGLAKGDVGRKYKYKVSAYMKGSSTPIELDPQVEISGGRRGGGATETR